MKAFTKSICFALVAMILGASSLHAQWDTIKNYHVEYSGERINDVFFISSTGYAVGFQNTSTNPYGVIGILSKTVDGGQTWNTTQMPFVVGTDSIVELRSVYFTTPNTGYVTAIGAQGHGVLLKTADGGLTWSSILSTRNLLSSINNTHVSFNSVQFTSLYSGFIAAYKYDGSTGITSGLVYSTTNGGVTWNNTTTFTSSPASSAFFNNAGTGCVVGGVVFDTYYTYSSPHDAYYWNYFSGEIARSTDGGNTWATTYTDANHAFSDVSFPSSQIGYATGNSLIFNQPNEIVKTVDGGQTWNVINTFSNFSPNCVYFIDNLTGYMGGVGISSLLKTIDGGLTWTQETYPNMSNENDRIVALSFPTLVTGYAVNDSITHTFHSSSSILGDFPTSSCSVFTGPDTTFCQTQGQLFATPGTPGPNYIFSWSPATGLSDPTSQSPFVNHVSNQQYVVTMTNTVTLCVATDTIVVSAYEMISSPQYYCSSGPNDSTILDFGPGASAYFWQFFTDTAGNTTNINQNTQTYTANQQGYYLGFANFLGCGAITSNVQIEDTCGTFAFVGNVWPGDCDYNLTADNQDALQIGLAYNTTGPVRPLANNSWTAQPMNDWPQNFVQCNYKHADATGNGTIDVNDTMPIYLNYGNTHPYRLRPNDVPATAPSIFLVANYDTVGLQTLVTVDVRLGTVAVPVDSLYGISFRITSDAGLIDTTLTIINLNTTWLGTMNNNMFGFRKYFRDQARVDATEVGNNLLNRYGGNGTIATFTIVTTDNLSGIAICHFNISDVKAVTISQHEVLFNSANDSVVIDPSHPAGISEFNATTSFNYYPNPSNEIVTVQTKVLPTSIEICDLQGRIISTIVPTSNSTTLNTSQFAEGVYLLRVRNGNAVTTQKFSVVH